MNPKEKAVRDAAIVLASAIKDASAAGLHVQWPHSPEGLAGIAISETKGVIPAGQPLDLSDEERAKLPKLDPNAVDDPEKRITAKAGSSKA